MFLYKIPQGVKTNKFCIQKRSNKIQQKLILMPTQLKYFVRALSFQDPLIRMLKCCTRSNVLLYETERDNFVFIQVQVLGQRNKRINNAHNKQRSNAKRSGEVVVLQFTLQFVPCHSDVMGRTSCKFQYQFLGNIFYLFAFYVNSFIGDIGIRRRIQSNSDHILTAVVMNCV